MVEKRTIILVALAFFVWASLATSFMAYYYMEQTRLKDQLNQSQQTLNSLIGSYDKLVAKWNLLSSKYGELVGLYQYFIAFNWFSGENLSICLEKYEILLSSLNCNYSEILMNSPELNETYALLLNDFQALKENPDQVMAEDFERLLNAFYKLFSALAIKELESTISSAGEIQVSLCINYTKVGGTEEWYNVSIPVGLSLFDLTRKVVKNIEYSYYPMMEPGHILITSIDGHEEAWLWYYWDNDAKCWVWGPVGCDAWILENNGIYKWDIY
ncbi:MAG: hypothetical protein QXK18_02480 [Candidatus Bathyarchaeia archaeon]